MPPTQAGLTTSAKATVVREALREGGAMRHREHLPPAATSVVNLSP
jgi:hypothetical protein